MKITFYGATGHVTGSRYLVEDEHTKILVDCGLVQEKEEFDERNFEKFPVEPTTIDAIVLTHAHIDHTGYIPALVKQGFKHTIYSSKGTYDLCKIMLPDSAGLMEEHAQEKKIAPLYTKKDAERALHLFHPVDFNKTFKIGSLSITLICSEHILGSSFVIISDGTTTLSFSGDLGRPHQLLMKAPPYLKETDYLVLESTYGDRLHPTADPIKAIGKVVNETVAKGGVLIIPAFAVLRSQTILYCLYELREAKQIPDIPIYLDSPMAIKVTNLFCKFKDELKVPFDICKKAFDMAIFTDSVEQSKKIDHKEGPMIIIAGSGMATGGRVLYHFKRFISDKKNTILFAGYQAAGTTGRSLVNGEKEVEIDGHKYPVHADIEKIGMLSAHADYNEILQWLEHFTKAPKKTFLTHGELKAAQSLQEKIEKKFAWDVVIPEYADLFELT